MAVAVAVMLVVEQVKKAAFDNDDASFARAVIGAEKSGLSAAFCGPGTRRRTPSREIRVVSANKSYFAEAS